MLCAELIRGSLPKAEQVAELHRDLLVFVVVVVAVVCCCCWFVTKCIHVQSWREP